jgi:molybdate transport system substrate-binding protein
MGLRRGLLLGLLLLALPACGPKPTERSVSVAAAADLQFALREVVDAFGHAHPDVKVKVTYGASGNFFSQINNGADFDLFLSADIDYPRQLVKAGLAVEGSEFTYALGHLVVWVPRDSSLDVEKRGMRALLDPRVRKIAIANPRHAPYGRAAEAAMKSLGVYDQVKDRLVLGENVTQAAQFAQKGAADVGVFSLSLALAPELRGGRYGLVPLSAYPRLEQGGVVLTRARDRASAEALRAFLIGAEGRAVLKRFGFEFPQP